MLSVPTNTDVVNCVRTGAHDGQPRDRGGNLNCANGVRITGRTNWRDRVVPRKGIAADSSLRSA